MDKEKRFFESLQNVFLGAKVEGTGGFIRLMQIKADYYKRIEEHLKQDIETALSAYPDFKDELFSKLYDFFSRYFSENGSIFFNSTPFHNNTYEKVYTDEKDVILFWKTQMLYYVKTDILFKSMDIIIDDYKFTIDASEIENKKNNERREIIFDLVSYTAEKKLVLKASYSTHGKKNKFDDIVQKTRTATGLTEDILIQATRTFKKQSEVDFFIHKEAETFLKEQFKLWSYQYFWEGAKEWTADRVSQIQILKGIAFKIIDFVAQFEDELVKIWNKPKFVRNSNYVITIDRVAEKDFSMIEKIISHKGIEAQIAEWKELGIVKTDFDKSSIINEDNMISEQYIKLPIDTKYFKNIEIDILGLFDNLDDALDGWIIKSDNYQALNTILPKFKERVQTIYIDPPFNTGNDFIFLDKFQEATWLSLISERLQISKNLMHKKGNLYLHLDHIAEHYGRILLDNYFNKDNFRAKITWNTGDNISGFKSQALNWIRQADFIHYYSKSKDCLFTKAYELINKSDCELGWLDVLGTNKQNLFIEIWENGVYQNKKIDCKVKAKGTIWNDIYSFQYSEPRITESLSFVSNQKPENLLRRIIQTSSSPRSIILDYYLGSGTTCAVAHKLNRRFLGIEVNAYFNEIYLDEVKIKKNTADENKESKQDDETLDDAVIEEFPIENNPAIVEIISETCKEVTVLMKKIGVLGRMKIVLKGDKEFMAIHSPVLRKPHLSKDVNWNGGGFFKYYELEQYDDVLDKCKYEDGELFSTPGKTPYEEYVFLKDEKLLETLDIDYDSDKVKVDLTKLYPDIDIAETLSNLKGINIKRITAESVEFTNGEVIKFNDIDYRDIRPLIWW